MKKLYRVDVYYFVMASSEKMALAVRPTLGDCSRQAQIAGSVPVDWWDAIPFGSEDDSTCGEILQDQKGTV